MFFDEQDYLDAFAEPDLVKVFVGLDCIQEALEHLYSKSGYELTESSKYMGKNAEIRAIVYKNPEDFSIIENRLEEVAEISEREFNGPDICGRSIQDSMDGFGQREDCFDVYVIQGGLLNAVGQFKVDVKATLFNHRITMIYHGPIDHKKRFFDMDGVRHNITSYSTKGLTVE